MPHSQHAPRPLPLPLPLPLPHPHPHPHPHPFFKRAAVAVPLLATLLSTACGAPAPASFPGSPAPGSAAAGASASPGGAPGDRAQSHAPVVEELQGLTVTDPYRWLEDGASPDVVAWTEAQNARTRAALDAIPGRDELRERARALLQIGSVRAPVVCRGGSGTRYFHEKRTGGQDQPVLYVRDGAASADRVLLDPAKLGTGSGSGPDATVALDWWFPSLDGALLTYGTSANGSEESVLHVRDVATGADLPDAIPFTPHASVAWVPDKKGFYYTRFPEPGAVPKGEERYHRAIYFHRLGRDWHKDKLVFEAKAKEDYPGIALSPSGRWLVATVFKGFDTQELFVRDRSKGDAAPWLPVAPGVRALFSPSPRDERLYVTTNDGAPNYRVFVVEYDHLDRALWREVVREGKDAIDDVHVLGDEIVVSYVHDASSRIERFTLAGKSKGEIALPSLGRAAVSGPYWGGEAFVEHQSFARPSEVLRYDLRSEKPGKGAKLEPWDRVGEGFTPPDVDVTLHFATSKDGTKVPMFVVAKKGLALDGTNPTFLWGYGGFNQSELPKFSTRAILALEHGAVWVSAILRGGGELGESWHQGGMLGKKQNVFDDFTACAQELVTAKVTSPEKLAVMGGSNGGLLVAAVVTQHPEMFGVAEALVPLTDMVRYARFGFARGWMSELGDPDKPDELRWLFAYSPYHHVKDGTRYPATLITTGQSDSRVDPLHARKMAARLEEAQSDAARPVLLRVETRAGHGQGKPASLLAEEYVDELSFALRHLGAAAKP